MLVTPGSERVKPRVQSLRKLYQARILVFAAGWEGGAFERQRREMTSAGGARF